MHEQDWSISNSGNPIVKSKKIPTRKNLKALFSVCQELFDEYSVDFGDAGWSNVNTFYDIRDSLMHPIETDDVSPPLDEVLRADNGRLWLREQFTNIRESVSMKAKSA